MSMVSTSFTIEGANFGGGCSIARRLVLLRVVFELFTMPPGPCAVAPVGQP